VRRTIAVGAFIAVACRPASNEGSALPTAGTTTSIRDATQSNISLTVDRSAYAAGATAQATVTNSSALVFGYNQCSSRSFERQETRGWVAVSEPARICTMELRLLKSKETQTFSVTLPQDVSAGSYRLVLSLSRQGPASSDQQPNTAVQVYSQAFRIE